MLFNLILDTLAGRFAEIAVENRWGKRLQDGTWVNIILFADNYWLVATDSRMLKKMTEVWLDILAEYGWETPVTELTWLSLTHIRRCRQTTMWMSVCSPAYQKTHNHTSHK